MSKYSLKYFKELPPQTWFRYAGMRWLKISDTEARNRGDTQRRTFEPYLAVEP